MKPTDKHPTLEGHPAWEAFKQAPLYVELPRRREKKRVGVHCRRYPRQFCGVAPERQRRRWRRYGKRVLDQHDRWAMAFEVRRRYPDVPLDQERTERRDERARRFWGGERRAIRRFDRCQCGAVPVAGSPERCPFCGARGNRRYALRRELKAKRSGAR